MLVTFIGIQLLAGLFIGILMGLGVAFLGWSETIFDTWQWPITILGWVIAVGACWLFLRYLDRPAPYAAANVGLPPPPPEFGNQMTSSFGNEGPGRQDTGQGT